MVNLRCELNDGREVLSEYSSLDAAIRAYHDRLTDTLRKISYQALGVNATNESYAVRVAISEVGAHFHIESVYNSTTNKWEVSTDL